MTRKNKYGNRKAMCHGKTFDSIGERDRYVFLMAMQKKGLIQDLRCQVPYYITVNNLHVCRYVADFVYDVIYDVTYGEGEVSQQKDTVVEDYKGYKTDVYKLKEKLMLAVHGIKIRVVKSPTAGIE